MVRRPECAPRPSAAYPPVEQPDAPPSTAPDSLAKGASGGVHTSVRVRVPVPVPVPVPVATTVHGLVGVARRVDEGVAVRVGGRVRVRVGVAVMDHVRDGEAVARGLCDGVRLGVREQDAEHVGVAELPKRDGRGRGGTGGWPSQAGGSRNVPSPSPSDRMRGGGGGAQGLGIYLFDFGGACWPLATAHSDPLWARTCFGCVNGAPG